MQPRVKAIDEGFVKAPVFTSWWAALRLAMGPERRGLPLWPVGLGTVYVATIKTLGGLHPGHVCMGALGLLPTATWPSTCCVGSLTWRFCGSTSALSSICS